ncbi:hypothetical protein GYMLUDRAFT_552704 [Collybiopsis luxurians FD-317 M1]|uniref:Uncharacterized protein n=1 Tax=Collybiopsis luxurians FD-317 M1 TaxID=944289 RepID=A0A0D0CZW7_9AGAR|nr:hypothetical protein GYMLUDRAFT_552704 [Collybiopsis luxurians FD-317 M1]
MKLLESRNAPASHDAFGVQRLTEDDLLPGVWLKIPMLIVLDTLKHAAPNWEDLGEMSPEVVASVSLPTSHFIMSCLFRQTI